MGKDIRARFDAGAGAWADYNQRPLGRIRCQVTWHNLAHYLPAITDPEHPPCVLDAGGGSGELALWLAQCGFRVWLLDYAPAMLNQARQAAQALPSAARERLTFCQLAVEDGPQSFAPGFFHAIACHTLIEYLPEPRHTLGILADLLHEGGMLSVSFVNHHAGVLRQVWSRADPAGALTSLENGTFCATLFDVPGVAYTTEEVTGWLADLGLAATATCGVRVFADYVPSQRLDDVDFFEDLLRLELAVAARPPYNRLARYVHLIAHKTMERI